MKLPKSPLLFLLMLAVSIFLVKKSIENWKQNQNGARVAHGAEQMWASDGSFQPNETRAWFLNEPISPLAAALPAATDSVVLGESSEEKWIDVDLSTQTLRAMEGDKIVYEFKISSGKWAPTPTGEYRIWVKYRYTKMSGGSKELHTYYYLPNVPYTMYFYQGYGIHGAYWHNNFGHPMSHGCINMAIPDAEKMFNWATPVLPEGKSVIQSTGDNPGTRVVIRGTAPRT